MLDAYPEDEDSQSADVASMAAASSAATDGAAEVAAPAGAALGLSSSHISPHRRVQKVRTDLFIELEPAKVAIAIGGGSVKLKGPQVFGWTGREKPRHLVGVKRGKIAGFSKGSRRRMLHQLAAIDQRKVLWKPLMVTLTYGAEWDQDPGTWKRHLQAFAKRVRRRFPDAAIIWRLEAQERGAPHYHLLVFNLYRLDHEWVGQVWASITAGNPAACSRVERVKSWRGVMAYASKYLAKLDGVHVFRAGPDGLFVAEVGRLWGVINAEKLPEDVREYGLSLGEFFMVRRLLRRLLRSQARARGRDHERRPRDATDGMAAFVPWFTAARLVESQVPAVGVTRLVIESMVIEEDSRFTRRLHRELEREKRQASLEGGREEAPSKSRRSRTALRSGQRRG